MTLKRNVVGFGLSRDGSQLRHAVVDPLQALSCGHLPCGRAPVITLLRTYEIGNNELVTAPLQNTTAETKRSRVQRTSSACTANTRILPYQILIRQDPVVSNFDTAGTLGTARVASLVEKLCATLKTFPSNPSPPPPPPRSAHGDDHFARGCESSTCGKTACFRVTFLPFSKGGARAKC